MVFNIFEKNKQIFKDIEDNKITEIDEANLDRDLTVPLEPNEFVSMSPTKSFSLPSRGGSEFSIPSMPISHFVGRNFWILKAINLNRGR